jgi:hypothetical protein
MAKLEFQDEGARLVETINMVPDTIGRRQAIMALRQFWCTRVRPPRAAWTGEGREETERGPPASGRG